MHRIDTESRALNLFGPGKDGYTQGDPLQGVAATQTSATHLNALQEELCNLIEGTGLALEKHDNTQLLKVVMRLARPFIDVLNWSKIPKTFVCSDICVSNSGSYWCLLGQSENKPAIWWTKKSTFEESSWSRAPVLTGGPVPGSMGDAGDDAFSAIATDGYRWVVIGKKTGEDHHHVFIATARPDEFTELEDSPLPVPASEPIEALARTTTSWVAVGQRGRLLVSLQPERGDWTSHEVTTVRLMDAAAHGRTVVAVGADGTVLRSGDAGKRWTVKSSGAGILSSVATNHRGMWVAVGDEANVAVSRDDGVTWKASQMTGLPYYLRKVAYGGWGLWMAVGQDGGDSFLATSQDAIEWTQRDFPSADLLTSVASAVGVWLVADAAGGLYTSLRS